jgi:H+-transporting ATPase
MVTGDAPATAAIVAHAVGLGRCQSAHPDRFPYSVKPEDFAVFASILPEGKFDLVKAFQKNGHAVGMCGDGANDAPALRQAQIGIAVSTATDVAKSAAGVVLTEAWAWVALSPRSKEGRVTFQRILTYTLNSTDQENRAGALIGHRPGNDWTCGFDSHAHGHRDDHRRLSGHVIDD